MGALFWHLAKRSAETEFIFALFQSLLAGLSLVVLLRHVRPARLDRVQPSDWLLPLGLLLLASQSAVHALHFGVAFFFHKEFAWAGVKRLTHGLRVCGFLVLVGACLDAAEQGGGALARWTLRVSSALAAVLAIDVLFPSRALDLCGSPDVPLLAGRQSRTSESARSLSR